MGISIFIPFLVGIVFAILVNFFSDQLPFSFQLTRPSCPNINCQKQFKWRDYLLLHRCPECGTRSRFRPLVVYIATISVSVYFWTISPPGIIFLLNMLAFSYLFIVALIDLEHHLILLPLNVAGLIILGTSGILLHGWLSTLVGGIAGAGILYFLFLLGKVFTRLRGRRLKVLPETLEDSLAFGDVILVGLLGVFLGWPNIWFGLLFGLLLAGVLGLAIIIFLSFSGKYKQRALSVFIPLGPGFIIAAMTIVYFPKIIAFLLL